MKTADEVLRWARTIRQCTGMLRTEPIADHHHVAEDLARGMRVAEEVMPNKFGNARWYLQAALVDAQMTNGWINWQASVQTALDLIDEAARGKETEATS